MKRAFDVAHGRRHSEFRLGCTGLLLIMALLVFFGGVIAAMF